MENPFQSHNPANNPAEHIVALEAKLKQLEEEGVETDETATVREELLKAYEDVEPGTIQ
jgi:hypothetical protein